MTPCSLRPRRISISCSISASEGAGGFIQDQNLGILRKRLGDFGHLHLAHPQMTDDAPGRDIQMVFLQYLLGIGVEFIPVDDPVFYRLLSQVNIFTDGDAGYQG